METHASAPSSTSARRQAPQPDGLAPQPHAGNGAVLDVGKRIDALVDTIWAFSALAAAVELGLLSDLDSPRTPAELAMSSGLSEALTSALLDVLASTGLARREELRYVGAPEVIALFKASPREDVLARLRSAHLQSRAMVDAARHGALRPGWLHTDPELLQAQGRSGRASTHAMARSSGIYLAFRSA